MKISNKWSFKRHCYYRKIINDKCSTYEEKLDEKVKCANCNKDIKFGNSYTSLQYHDDVGFGYAVCDECYKKECMLKLENKIEFTQVINGVEHRFEVEENQARKLIK